MFDIEADKSKHNTISLKWKQTKTHFPTRSYIKIWEKQHTTEQETFRYRFRCSVKVLNVYLSVCYQSLSSSQNHTYWQSCSQQPSLPLITTNLITFNTNPTTITISLITTLIRTITPFTNFKNSLALKTFKFFSLFIQNFETYIHLSEQELHQYESFGPLKWKIVYIRKVFFGNKFNAHNVYFQHNLFSLSHLPLWGQNSNLGAKSK